MHPTDTRKMYVLSDSSKNLTVKDHALFTETDNGSNTLFPLGTVMPLALCFFTMQDAFKGTCKQLFKTLISKIQYLDDAVESPLLCSRSALAMRSTHKHHPALGNRKNEHSFTLKSLLDAENGERKAENKEVTVSSMA